MDRYLDILFLIYFGTHIPIALFNDSQAVFPKWLYPTQLTDVLDWYTSKFRDSLMAGHPAWFQSFCMCEMLLQFPFFFVAFYAYWKGVSKCQWIRIPIIVYSTHVATSLICILYHIALHDFSRSEHPGPRNTTERLQLSLFYMPYLIVPIILLYDAIVHPIYKETLTISKNSNRPFAKRVHRIKKE